MFLKKDWELLAPTQQELEAMEALAENADPTTRLQVCCNNKNFYLIKKQWICYQWYIALYLENENIEIAHSNYVNELQLLKESYERDMDSVSYTHLTLPTICSV